MQCGEWVKIGIEKIKLKIEEINSLIISSGQIDVNKVRTAGERVLKVLNYDGGTLGIEYVNQRFNDFIKWSYLEIDGDGQIQYIDFDLLKKFTKQLVENYSVNGLLIILGNTIKSKSLSIPLYSEIKMKELGYFDIDNKFSNIIADVPEEIIAHIIDDIVVYKVSESAKIIKIVS